MILNHKDAIEFLVGAADDIGFNRYTILNLHAILANNLLADQAAAGRLRHIGVGIERSTFHPPETPQLIEECFDQLLATAAAIADPFEQAFFVMVQLPYLQPFDDVNKRVSRLAANIPFIKAQPLATLVYGCAARPLHRRRSRRLRAEPDRAAAGLCSSGPMSARPRAMPPSGSRSASPILFGCNTVRRCAPLSARSCTRRMDRKAAAAHVAQWIQENVASADRERFREIAESELLGLHEGNFARYEIRPAEFAAWRQVWTETAA